MSEDRGENSDFRLVRCSSRDNTNVTDCIKSIDTTNPTMNVYLYRTCRRRRLKAPNILQEVQRSAGECSGEYFQGSHDIIDFTERNVSCVILRTTVVARGVSAAFTFRPQPVEGLG